MAHLGTLRDFRFNQDVDDIRGTDVYGLNDEKLGEVDDIIFDHSTGQIQYAVVDAGGWLSSKKFLVPADRIHERAGHEDDFAVDVSRERIKDFPEYNERSVEDKDDWREYETRYRDHAKWDEGPVLHKEGSVNIITPEPDEMPAASGGGTGGMDVTPTRLAGTFPDTAPDPSKLRMRPAGMASEAEDSKVPGAARGTQDREIVGGERGGGVQRDDAGVRDSRIPHVNAEVNARNSAQNLNPDDVGYGDIDRTAVPVEDTRNLPPSYRDTVDGQLDATNDMHRPYPVQEGRHRRWAAFEDHLRRNRVDITSSCRACDTAKEDEAA